MSAVEIAPELAAPVVDVPVTESKPVDVEAPAAAADSGDEHEQTDEEDAGPGIAFLVEDAPDSEEEEEEIPEEDDDDDEYVDEQEDDEELDNDKDDEDYTGDGDELDDEAPRKRRRVAVSRK